jgi:hypothetical protein
VKRRKKNWLFFYPSSHIPRRVNEEREKVGFTKHGREKDGKVSGEKKEEEKGKTVFHDFLTLAIFFTMWCVVKFISKESLFCLCERWRCCRDDEERSENKINKFSDCVCGNY